MMPVPIVAQMTEVHVGAAGALVDSLHRAGHSSLDIVLVLVAGLGLMASDGEGKASPELVENSIAMLAQLQGMEASEISRAVMSIVEPRVARRYETEAS